MNQYVWWRPGMRQSRRGQGFGLAASCKHGMKSEWMTMQVALIVMVARRGIGIRLREHNVLGG